jgi:transcriptional regulator with XRE-family HTH domain
MNPQERFAVNLRRARTELGLSQEQLGSRCGLRRTEVSLLERGGREPRLGTIAELAAALATTPSRLCAGIFAEPEPVPPSGFETGPTR